MKSVILINPFVSAEYLSNKFKENNIYCIGVYIDINNNLDEYSKPDLKLFDKQLFFNNESIQNICNHLSIYNTNYIINGSEESTYITDCIAEQLTPKLANKSSTSYKRSDKYHMQEIIRQFNLPHITQIKFNINQFDVKKFNCFKFPIFFKPVHGYGSINAVKLVSHSELIAKVNQLKLNTQFNEYLVQEYINGTEYIVDTFSVNGTHYLTDIIKYHKENHNGSPVYRYAEIVVDDLIWNKVEIFISQILNILEFKNGMAHNEIFIDKEGNLKFIELNNRVSGAKGYLNKMVQLSNLKSHDELLIAYLKNQKYYKTNFMNLKVFSRCLFLFNFTGQLAQIVHKHFHRIKSIQEIKLLTSLEKNIITTDFNLLNCSCILLLHNSDYNQLNQDTKYIFQLEKSKINASYYNLNST